MLDLIVEHFEILGPTVLDVLSVPQLTDSSSLLLFEKKKMGRQKRGGKDMG